MTNELNTTQPQQNSYNPLISNQVIKKTSVSQQQIYNDILEYLETNPQFADIKNNLAMSSLNMFLQTLAGVIAFNLYNQNLLRMEGYLGTAINPNSIYLLAHQLGYNINRYSCPQFQLQYNQIPTPQNNNYFQAQLGQVLGSYQDYDLVSLQTKTLRDTDTIEVGLGVWKTLTATFTETDGEFYSISLTPQTLTSIDNNNIYVIINNTLIKVSRDLETIFIDYNVIDFSTSTTNTELKFSKTNYSLNQQVTIAYLETDGLISSIDFSSMTLQPNFSFSDILSYGLNCDSIQKIKDITPFYYLTLRRGVTLEDITTIAKSSNLIKDAIALEVEGTAGKYTIPVKGNAQALVGSSVSVSLTPEQVVTTKVEQTSNLSVLSNLISSLNAIYGITATSDTDNLIIETSQDLNYQVSPVGSSNFFGETQTNTQGLPKPCCTLLLYYIHANQPQSNDILTLTDKEQLDYSLFLKQFIIAGVSLLMLPAQAQQLTISLTATAPQGLVSSIAQQIKDFILKTISLKIGYNFQYYSLLGLLVEEFAPLGVIIQPDFNQKQVSLQCNNYEYIVADIEVSVNEN